MTRVGAQSENIAIQAERCCGCSCRFDVARAEPLDIITPDGTPGSTPHATT
jgi:hypothetical protein